jgi:hypothetical protein
VDGTADRASGSADASLDRSRRFGRHTNSAAVPRKLAGSPVLRRSLQADDRQVWSPGVVVNVEFDPDTGLTADECSW